MFKSSITKFLIASLGMLMTGLFVTALILAVQAWTNNALAGRIARLTSTDRTLFDALITVRAQVPKDSTALITQDDPRPVISTSHQQASKAVAIALDALESTDIADHVQLAAAIRSAWQEVKAQQSAVDVQASRARGERNLHAIDDWRTAIHEMLEALSIASVTAIR
jgi:hypothetical protein